MNTELLLLLTFAQDDLEKKIPFAFQRLKRSEAFILTVVSAFADVFHCENSTD